MKRVILILTLALFVICLTVPSAAFARNHSNKTAAFDNRTQEIGQTKTSVTHDMKRSWGESLRHLFGSYFISMLPGAGITVIDISWDDPLNGPPGPRPGDVSDRRPETDDDGWAELDK